ncbi:hypothetical protein HMPREF9120_02010 [Neisseria sp. oral taxon 020 str. F0370]|nr:hypothetical protein HMPREF9120_02010 [Neisseria sp. oral taxon 020 str. F0370]
MSSQQRLFAFRVISDGLRSVKKTGGIIAEAEDKRPSEKRPSEKSSDGL